MFGLVGIIVGIVLILMGTFMVFFFPVGFFHQPVSMSVTGIVLGIIFWIVGFVLIFM